MCFPVIFFNPFEFRNSFSFNVVVEKLERANISFCDLKKWPYGISPQFSLFCWQKQMALILHADELHEEYFGLSVSKYD